MFIFGLETDIKKSNIKKNKIKYNLENCVALNNLKIKILPFQFKTNCNLLKKC